MEEEQQQPQTINPSLLDRNTAGRRLLFDLRNGASRVGSLDDSTKRNKVARNSDVLHKAREMGKKIWSLDKFTNMLSVLLESEARPTSQITKTAASRDMTTLSKGSREPNLLQLLHNERINGPSDRDPSALNRELNFFKGPFLYIWDMEEKQKPVMVREYAKVSNKSDGEWPQFRSVGNGRCPFVEEVEAPENEHRRAKEQEKAQANKQNIAPPPKPTAEMAAPKTVASKRTLAEMEGGQHKGRCVAAGDIFNPARASLSKQTDARPQNAFVSRAEVGRVFAGEPVASGIQPSNITSAIRSQMISSTSGINGAKAGTSKEVHGLQRKVLQRATPATSHDVSSRRIQEMSMEVASSRSTTMSRPGSKAMQAQEEDGQKGAVTRERRSHSQSLKSKKDLKPGYCENCQDKFRDFDEVSTFEEYQLSPGQAS